MAFYTNLARKHQTYESSTFHGTGPYILLAHIFMQHVNSSKIQNIEIATIYVTNLKNIEIATIYVTNLKNIEIATIYC
jgi:hypothetical protein